jgi:glycosyltransferase involved in cell wall biosynthesis
VPPGDVAALAERLRWMARHGASAEALGQRGRRKVEERFSPAVHYAGLSRIYARVLA